MWLGQIFAQRLGDRPRDALGRLDLVQGITVTLEELDLLSVQAEDLIAVGRLKDAHQGLGVEAVGHDRQFGDRPLERVHPEHALCAQHCQAVKSVIPEVAVVGQCRNGSSSGRTSLFGYFSRSDSSSAFTRFRNRIGSC